MRKGPLIILWLDNLGVFHPPISELGLTNIAADSDRHLSSYARCLIQGVDMLIVNTPFFEHQEEESHLSVEEAITLKDEVGANKLILTHANHSNLPHDELETYVAQFEGITVAYDGLTVEV